MLNNNNRILPIANMSIFPEDGGPPRALLLLRPRRRRGLEPPPLGGALPEVQGPALAAPAPPGGKGDRVGEVDGGEQVRAGGDPLPPPAHGEVSALVTPARPHRVLPPQLPQS